ncbi:GNAT family N-acetyltransferase [Streptomyces sp. NPDC020681]|uniref:GNAT family N-acetyltransferase n=1 Tax=Streptomyces sp. NPDC020681 TaxID=3365083 RepID=UPI00378732DD
MLAGYSALDEEPRPLFEWRSLHGVLRASGLPFVAAVHEGTVLGYCHAQPMQPGWVQHHIVQVSCYVCPSHVGRLIGTRLLREFLVRGARTGVREVVAMISDVESERTVSFFGSQGFDFMGRFRSAAVKRGRTVDLLLMQCSITPARGGRAVRMSPVSRREEILAPTERQTPGHAPGPASQPLTALDAHETDETDETPISRMPSHPCGEPPCRSRPQLTAREGVPPRSSTHP